MGGVSNRCIAPVLAIAALAVPAAAHPWDDPGLSPDEKAALVVKAATLQELQDLLHAPMLAFVPAARRPAGAALGADYVPGIPRLGIPPLIATDASLGVANGMNMRAGDVATAFPSGLALAASFDPVLAHDGGAAIGAEAKAKGFNVLLGGGVNLTREPRGGRDFEYLGEDPLLAGRMVAAQIGGVQSAGIISTIKHYALNAQETGRSAVSAEMSEKAMRESDLLAFRIGIEEGRPGAVMCSYNRVNGVYACENPFLLTQVLRKDWHYPGYVMSDWGAVHSTEALLKGLDQQSGEQIDTKRFFGQELSAELASGAIPQSAVRTAAQCILSTIFAHGLTKPAASAAPIDYAAHAEVAQRQAEAGIVLLRNEGGLLPVAATAKSILIVGGHADIGVLSGGGSSQVRPVGGPALEIRSTNPLTASFSKRVYVPSPPLAALKAALPGADIRFVDGSDAGAAAAAAAKADLAIVFADKWATEGEDNKDLSLEPGQDALIDAVAAANSRTVVVLETGNPVLMPWADKVGAIVEAWYPGQRGGEAIAAVLTGKVDPSGRLPITFPAAVDQLPNPVLPGSDLPPPDKALRATYGIMATTAPFDAHYPEGSDVGYRWYAARGLKPLFPFGHGLSYTRFAYSRLKLVSGKQLQARFTVTNAGTRAGIDVPQLYVSGRRAKRLAGWARLSLMPGESRVVTIAADPRVMADYDVDAGRYVVAPGRYRIEIGTSAADTRSAASTSVTRQVLAP